MNFEKCPRVRFKMSEQYLSVARLTAAQHQLTAVQGQGWLTIYLPGHTRPAADSHRRRAGQRTRIPGGPARQKRPLGHSGGAHSHRRQRLDRPGLDRRPPPDHRRLRRRPTLSQYVILDKSVTLFMGVLLSAVFPAGTQVALGGKRRGLRHVARRDERGRIYSGWVRSGYIRFCDDQSEA